MKSDFYYPFQFIIFCTGLTKKGLLSFRNNPALRESYMLRYEYFIVDEGDFINLWTFVWYSPEKCNQLQLVLVNKFSKKTKNWDTKKFLIEKFANLYGCKLNFFFKESFPSYFFPKFDENNEDCAGYTCETAKALSGKLNYTYDSHIDMMHPLKPKHPNGIIPEVYDLRWLGVALAASYQMRYEKSRFYFYSTTFDFVECSIAIPKGESLDSYERIIRPFDAETWTLVVITFATAFTSIFVIKFGDNHLKDFVFGSYNSTPGLNVLRIFFGISQIRCPARNFGRFLLMSFILFSIVIRTAYQAKMFQFLQMNLVKPTFDTVDELIENNFTFFMRVEFSVYYKNSDFVRR